MCFFHALRASLLRLFLQNIYDILPAWVLYAPLAKYTELLNFSARPNTTEEHQSFLPWKPATLEPVQALSEPQTHTHTQTTRPAVEPGEFVPLLKYSPPTTDNAQLGNLCSKCRLVRVWLQANQPLSTRPKETNIQSFEGYSEGCELEQSYLDGCHLCTLLWYSMLSAVTSTLPAESRNDRKLGKDQARKVSGLQLSLLCLPPSSDPTKIRLTLRLSWGDGKPIVRLGSHIELFLSTWPRQFRGVNYASSIPGSGDMIATSGLISISPESFLGPATKWIRECRSSHKHCKQKALETPWVPTRLLDVGPSSAKYNPRVVKTAGAGITGPYLTLSYCWGGRGHILLEKHNLADFERGIPIDELPKTIFDAIIVTKKLGFRWLWVDSLCIIQKDAQEWLREADSMGDVYSESFLTIAALGASTADGGLFGQRDPLVYSSCEMFQNTEGDNVYVHPKSEWETFSSIFENAPLHRRGWVTQERLLSPRTLNFGAFLVWECRESYQDEFNLSRRKQTLTLKGRLPVDFAARSNVELTTNGLGQIISPEAKQVFYPFWCDLLAFYTKAHLTNATDRPIAIAGAIQTIKRRTGWKNIVGLWEPFLLQELLWFINEPQDQRSGTNPTWSWLSIDQGVKSACRFPPTQFLASIEDTTASLSKNGWNLPVIHLKCRLLKFSELPTPFSKKKPRQTDSRFIPDIGEYDSTETFFAPIVEVSNRFYGLALQQSRTVHDAYERVGVIYYAKELQIDSSRTAKTVIDDAVEVTIILV